MKNCKIYYFHNLNLSFKSAQTLQVIKDYYFLSKKGYQVFLHGVYENVDELNSILEYINDSSITILYQKTSKINKLLNKIKFLFKIRKDNNNKIIITRHHKKINEISFFRNFFNNEHLFHEMHEESFPHLLKDRVSRDSSLACLEKTDALIFTNYSQVELYEKEFNKLPKRFVILPNGVELERFRNIKFKENFVLTYLGQFNIWKNIELIFASFSLLDDKYTLRIAGGKGDSESKEYIYGLINKYSIDESRVDYLGFVNNKYIEDVLNESNVLLLPLGNNIQSKYLTSPMKLFEYMSTKIPVLAVDYPTINLIASENEIYLSKNNAKSFADTIKEINFNSKLRNEKVLLMNKLVKKFSYTKRSDLYDKFIKEL